MARVLVTGGTGFVAAHCLVQLLAAGHETRATVRDLKRDSHLRAMLRQGGAGEVGERLTLFRADLSADEARAPSDQNARHSLLQFPREPPASARRPWRVSRPIFAHWRGHATP